MAKVTGIGGVFFKSKSDHKALAAWYQQHLGIQLEESFGGAILKWEDDKADDKGMTVWSTAAKETKWFSPSESDFMINYRIDDMNGMIAQLTTAGIPILKGPDVDENGKFAWIMDPDGNKVELWEPKLMPSQE
jgi:predicted enzyme related to lactoylglutathione lyase